MYIPANPAPTMTTSKSSVTAGRDAASGMEGSCSLWRLLVGSMDHHAVSQPSRAAGRPCSRRRLGLRLPSAGYLGTECLAGWAAGCPRLPVRRAGALRGAAATDPKPSLERVPLFLETGHVIQRTWGEPLSWQGSYQPAIAKIRALWNAKGGAP